MITRKILALIFLFAMLTAQAERTNVVVILVDDLGLGWIPPYAARLSPEDIEPEVVEKYTRTQGHQGAIDLDAHIRTARSCMPELSKLAEEGAVFTRAFATASLCAPSRAGVLTGTFQQRWGAYRNRDIDDFGVPEDRTVLAEPLKAAGYRTGIVGKWHIAKQDPRYLEEIWVSELGQELPVTKHYNGLWPELSKALKKTPWKTSSMPGQHPLDKGFDYYFGYNSYDDEDYNSRTLWENHELVPQRPDGEFLTDLLNKKAVAFIDSALRDKQPFFLYYAPKTLHGGIKRPPEHYVDAFNSGNRFTDEYAGHMLALDDGIGKIIQTLKKHGASENTLFIFTSDNGCTLYNVPPHNAPNRGGKGSGWMGGLNVPLIIWQGGKVRSGFNDEIVSLADIMPTVLEAAQVAPPANIDGLSILSFLLGQSPKGPRDSLGSANIHSSRWSFSYEAKGENNKFDADIAPLYAWYLKGDEMLMLTTAIRPGLYENIPEGYQAQTLLYNIADDRAQRVNIAQGNLVEGNAGKIEEFQREIHKWLSGMAEPLISQKEDYHELLERTAP